MGRSERCATPSDPSYLVLSIFIIVVGQPIGLLNGLASSKSHHHLAELPSDPDRIIGIAPIKNPGVEEHERVTALTMQHHSAVFLDHINPIHQTKINYPERQPDKV
jgi:hypothetical protein